jgi:hypothetical protein
LSIIIRKRTISGCTTIAEIRNRLSHSHLKIGFDDITIMDLCNQLKGWSYFAKEDKTTPRRKFVLTVIRMAAPLQKYLEVVPPFTPKKISPLGRVYRQKT